MTLRADGLTVAFGGVVAVDDVSLALDGVETLGIIGPNGSGKTTVLNAITGVVPAKGTLEVDGTSVRLGRPGASRRAGIMRVFQHPQTFDALSCLENVVLSSRDRFGTGVTGATLLRPWMVARERRRWTRAHEALDFVGLGAMWDLPAGELPYGQQRLLELARALAGDPTILLLDEPSAGLNETETNGLLELLREVARQGMAIIVVDHKIDFIDALCDRVAVLELGKLIALGTPADIWGDARVMDAYLGVVEGA